jgi:putative ABC transport system permease protein
MYQETPLIFKALRRHKTAVALLVFQIALTLAVLLNCFNVIADAVRLGLVRTGIDEANISTIQSITVVGVTGKTSVARNLIQLSQIPGVADAAFGPVPFSGVPRINLSPGIENERSSPVNFFLGSQGYVKALGLKIIAGTTISDVDIPDLDSKDPLLPALITEALRRKFFGNAGGVGEILLGNGQKFRVIGVVRSLHRNLSDDAGDDLSIISEVRYGDLDMGGLYIVRSNPGDILMVKKKAEDELATLNPTHVQSSSTTFPDLRNKVIGRKNALAHILAVLVFILMAITGFGIGSLTTMWVELRKTQIGIRFALGATWKHILYYFLVENFMIVTSGGIFGVALAEIAGRYAVQYLELPPPSLLGGFVSFVAVIFLGQAFAFFPAWRACQIAPSAVIRNL